MILSDDDVRRSVESVFASNGFKLDLKGVREVATRRDVCFVYGQTIHWNEYFRILKIEALGWDGIDVEHIPVAVVRFWRGVCHECAHVWQEQEWGRWKYAWAVLDGVRRSFPKLWDHDKIPMEMDADTKETGMWKPSMKAWLRRKAKDS